MSTLNEQLLFKNETSIFLFKLTDDESNPLTSKSDNEYSSTLPSMNLISTRPPSKFNSSSK